MPTREVILEHANKAFFRFFTQFCTAKYDEKAIYKPIIQKRQGTGTTKKTRSTHKVSSEQEGRNRTACVGLVVHAGAATQPTREYKEDRPTQR